MRSFEKESRGPYIKMHSGRKFYLADPRAEDIDVNDVARHLAGINRYTGGSRYSVAQHCVAAARMAEVFYPNETLLPARMLIHDADEAYYGDVSSPLKSLLPDYRALEQAAQLAVEKKFDLLFVGDKLHKEVDFRMWLTEREILFAGRHGKNESDYDGPLRAFELNADDAYYFEEWPAERAETAWHIAYRRYFAWLQ